MNRPVASLAWVYIGCILMGGCSDQSLKQALMQEKIGEVNRIISSDPSRVNDRFTHGNTPLHLTFNVDICDIFIQHGAHVNARNDYGNTPLHFAAARGDVEIVRSLVAAGADVNAINSNYESPLLCAIGGFMEPPRETGFENNANRLPSMTLRNNVLTTLLSSGADPNLNSTWCSPLHFAVIMENIEAVRRLVSQGADITSRNADGLTPYELARKFGRRDEYAKELHVP